MNKFKSLTDRTKRYSTSSFRSFIGRTQTEHPYDDYVGDPNPILLEGEEIIGKATNVLLFTPVSDKKTGLLGVLFVTNFKLSFVTLQNKDLGNKNCQKNNFLGPNDVCLSNIDMIYQVGSERKKKLLPGRSVFNRVKGLFIVCKNLRTLSFSFKLSPSGHGKTLTNILMHHAFPRKHHLLFAYDFKEPYIKFVKNVLSFREAGDWGKELSRTKASGWRLSSVNQKFDLSDNMSKWIVVSLAVKDWQLTEAARHYRHGRTPVWCWSTQTGAALVRSADIIPTISDRVQENVMLETVRNAHPKKTQPIILDLTKDLPSLKNVEMSYNKFRDLCTPDSLRQFWIQDREFYNLVDSSKWLNSICQCLTKSLEAAKNLENDITIVLQEEYGRDMCCLISSLVQIFLDPYYRTLDGFQSLIQKEWVVMGHPFCSRLGHVFNLDPSSEKAPLLLLFLDCVWQLVQQFPSHFQFTETFLTTLWDSAHMSIFDTFLFDNDKERYKAVREAGRENGNSFVLRSIWDWGEQYSDKDISLFYNKIYNPTYTESLVNNVQISMSNLQFWSQCYFRFLPQLEIVGGGNPQVELIIRSKLNQSSETLEDLPCEKIGSFYPFTQWRESVGISPPLNLQLSYLSLYQNGDDTQSVYTVQD